MKRHYRIAHRVAKLLMVSLVLALLALDGSLTLFNGLAIGVWVFMVNPLAYVLESVLHWKHTHDKL